MHVPVYDEPAPRVLKRHAPPAGARRRCWGICTRSNAVPRALDESAASVLGSVSKFFPSHIKRMFKNILRIAVQQAFPLQKKRRPALLSFDEDIVRVVCSGAIFARLPLSRTSPFSRRCTSGSTHHSSVLLMNASSDCIDGVRGLAIAASIPLSRIRLCTLSKIRGTT